MPSESASRFALAVALLIRQHGKRDAYNQVVSIAALMREELIAEKVGSG